MHNFIDALNFNLIVIRTQADGRFTIFRVNHAAANLLGYSEDQLVNRAIDCVFASDDGVQALVSGRSGVSFDADIITKQQDIFQALISVSLLPGEATDYVDSVLLIQPIKSGNDLLVMRRIVQQSASAMMITDARGQIVYVNPKFTALAGYTADELLGQNPRLLQSDNMSPEYYQVMWDTLLREGDWQGEIQNRKKSGEAYWVFESISAIKDSVGHITHFLSVEEDITHRKHVESALIESEERFRQMADMAGEWLWEQDSKGYYSYSSAAVKQILGFSQEQIIGKHYTEFLTAQDKESQTQFAGSHQAFYALINHYQHKDGHLVITESTGLPILNAEGRVVKWRGVDRDISARMHFQNALIDSEKRTRLIIESSINAIVIMDSYGIITDWNHRAVKMFGWSADEAIGQRLDELIIPKRFHSAHRLGMHAFLQTGVGPILNKQTEQVAVNRDGIEFPVELSVSPLKLGNAYIFSGFIHDISGRKAAEQQIRQSHVDLAVVQNEIKIAQQIQARLTPFASINSDAFEIAGVCLPADQVGGDYYDYFFRNDNLLDVVIADVSGHSIGPALFMVEARSAIRAQHDLSATPTSTLGVLNTFLFDDLDNSDYFITLFYLQVNLQKKQLSYANAGHPPPLLLRHSQDEIYELDAEGLIFGIKKNITFEEKSLTLLEGDVMLLYTDGLIEAENANQEFFGLARVKTILRQNSTASPQIIIDALFAALRQFCQKSSFDDDITLVVFKWC